MGWGGEGGREIIKGAVNLPNLRNVGGGGARGPRQRRVRGRGKSTLADSGSDPHGSAQSYLRGPRSMHRIATTSWNWLATSAVDRKNHLFFSTYYSYYLVVNPTLYLKLYIYIDKLKIIIL